MVAPPLKVARPVTPRVEERVVAPVTPRVPPSVVAPVPTVKVFEPETEELPFKVTPPVPVEKVPVPDWEKLPEDWEYPVRPEIAPVAARSPLLAMVNRVVPEEEAVKIGPRPIWLIATVALPRDSLLTVRPAEGRTELVPIPRP